MLGLHFLKIKEVDLITSKKEVIVNLDLGVKLEGEDSRVPFVQEGRGGRCLEEMNVAAKLPDRWQAEHNYCCILKG